LLKNKLFEILLSKLKPPNIDFLLQFFFFLMLGSPTENVLSSVSPEHLEILDFFFNKIAIEQKKEIE